MEEKNVCQASVLAFFWVVFQRQECRWLLCELLALRLLLGRVIIKVGGIEGMQGARLWTLTVLRQVRGVVHANFT